MRYFLFAISFLFSLVSFSANQDCREVAPILRKSFHFKNTDLAGQHLGFVYIEPSPMGRWLQYDSDASVVAKSSPNKLVGQINLQVVEGRCSLVILHPRMGAIGHDVLAKDANTIELRIAKDDTEVFFRSSLLTPITDDAEKAEVSKRFTNKNHHQEPVNKVGP